MSTALADLETSSDDYARRFAGATGGWFLQVQESALVSMVTETKSKRVLDVGGGHGQIALPLASRGFSVTVVGSDPLANKQIIPLIKRGKCSFQVANLYALPFPDGAFETVTCIRLLSHCDRVEDLIKELCRVSSDRVIVDYPVKQSVNVLTPLLFRLKKKIESNTRTYTLFEVDEISRYFSSHGFKSVERSRQFFWPMVLHRALRSPFVSRSIEALPSFLGLRSRLGSPILEEFRVQRWPPPKGLR